MGTIIASRKENRDVSVLREMATGQKSERQEVPHEDGPKENVC